MKFNLIPAALLDQITDDLAYLKAKLHNVLADQDGVLDTDQACTFLRCSKRTLQKYRDQGAIIFYQRGKMIWFKRSDLLIFLNRHRKENG